MRPEVERSYAFPQHIAGADLYCSLYRAHNAIRNAAWSVANAPERVDNLVAVATTQASRAGSAS
jgi:hypothetical protein